MRLALGIAATIAMGSSLAAAGTTTVPFASDYSQHHLAQFNGTATYDSSSGNLTLVIQNTTGTSAGGNLTSFAFDHGGVVAAYADPDGGHLPNTNGFDELRNRRGMIHAAPFGVYHAGAALDGKWGGSHAISRGVAAGQSETFVFDITGPNVSSLTVADFFTAGKNGQEIVATFKELPHHRTDHVGAVISGPMASPSISGGGTAGDSGSDSPPLGSLIPTPDPSGGNGGDISITPSAVPLPPAVWTSLATLGLIGLGALVRKYRPAAI